MPSSALYAILLVLFGISFASNATPFFGASYTLLATSELIAAGFNLANFVLIVAITALGATLAKLVMYSGAFGFRKELQRNKNIRLLHEWLQKRSFLVALFVTAVIPALPLDDYIYIGAGANKARLAPMIAVTLPAKVIKSGVEIFLEFNGILDITSLSKGFLGLSSLELSVLLSIGFIALGVFLYKLDWESLFRTVSKKGREHDGIPD